MICITPNQIKNPDPVAARSERYLLVPCRKCSHCLKTRAKAWMFRLQQENKIASTAFFMTYTYDRQNVPISDNGLYTLNPKHHTLFMKRLRKGLKKEGFDLPLKYYMVGEYGGQTERPHYHSIMFNLPKSYTQMQWNKKDDCAEPSEVEKIWQKGIVSADQVTDASIAYVCGYVNKQKFFSGQNENDDRIQEFSRMSKNLGENFLTDERIKALKNRLSPTISIEDGKKIAVPSYYWRKMISNVQLHEDEFRLISDKKRAYAQDHPFFRDEKHHHDYVKVDGAKRLRNTKNRNKI